MNSGDVWLVVIGAGLGFAASIGTSIIERCFERAGKLKIYYHYTCAQGNVIPFGFTETINDDLMFCVPIICEIQNTSREARVIRDLNILLYNKGERFCEAIQVTTDNTSRSAKSLITETHKTDFGGEKHSYSFVASPRSIQRQICSFLYQIHPNQIDENKFDNTR